MNNIYRIMTLSVLFHFFFFFYQCSFNYEVSTLDKGLTPGLHIPGSHLRMKKQSTDRNWEVRGAREVRQGDIREGLHLSWQG